MLKLIPLVLALIGLGAGLGLGLFLKPHEDPTAEAAPKEEPKESEFVKLSNQFIIPLLEGGRVTSMVVMSLSLETTPGQSELVFAKEPKLKSALLQVMFDHANSGGFRGTFTEGTKLDPLRKSLREAATLVLGDIITDVLITDIGRQDS